MKTSCSQAISANESTPSDWAPANVFRPIQYLGSKLRSLPFILNTADKNLDTGGLVVDLFSGTSVVAQAFAAKNNRVLAVDSQPSCQTIATALLGVGRRQETVNHDLALRVISSASQQNLEEAWAHLINLEDRALSNRDYEALVSISKRLPLVWNYQIHNRFKWLRAARASAGQSAVGQCPLFALTLAGSYFGIRQALAIDSLRWAIDFERRRGKITSWQFAALLTAIMSAMSKSVYSAGKHFAQPLTAGCNQSQLFRKDRIMVDRRVDIYETFTAAIETMSRAARSGYENHCAISGAAETAVYSLKEKISFVYADPPYTAQQYSRFYHALDTLVNYRVHPFVSESFQTTGLYPPDRFKSAFCSKRNAPRAFESMIRSIRDQETNFLLSYSLSRKGSNGNYRVVDLDQIVSLCHKYFGKRRTKIIELRHAYRQFNSRDKSNERRNDPELLIACRC